MEAKPEPHRTRSVWYVLFLVILFLILLPPSPVDAGSPNICRHRQEWENPRCNDGNPYNGYWWFGRWVPAFTSQESWFTPAPTYFYGRAVFYGPGVMRGTAEVRDLNLEGYVDGVAIPTCADIGLPVWLRRPGHDWEGPFLVVDCATNGDIYGVVFFRQEAVEVGWRTAVRWGMAEWGGDLYKVNEWLIDDVQVSKVPPAQLEYAGAKPVHYPTWFEEIWKPTHRYEQRPVYRSPSTWRLANGEWVTYYSPTLTRVQQFRIPNDLPLPAGRPAKVRAEMIAFTPLLVGR